MLFCIIVSDATCTRILKKELWGIDNVKVIVYAESEPVIDTSGDIDTGIELRAFTVTGILFNELIKLVPFLLI